MARFKRASKNTDGAGGTKAGSDSRREVITLVIAYLKQETLEPLKGLARFVAFGAAGSMAIGVGTVLLLIAILRVLQTETGAFHGNLSWLPYVIDVALAAAVIALSVWRIVAGPAVRRRTTKKTGD